MLSRDLYIRSRAPVQSYIVPFIADLHQCVLLWDLWFKYAISICPSISLRFAIYRILRLSKIIEPLDVSDKVWLCQVGKDIHEKSSYGTSIKDSSGKRSCNGLYVASRSPICFQNSSGSQHNNNNVSFYFNVTIQSI